MELDYPDLILGALLGGLFGVPLTLLLQDPVADLLAHVPWLGTSEQRKFSGRWKATYQRLDKPSESPDGAIEEELRLWQVGSRVVGRKLTTRKRTFFGWERQVETPIKKVRLKGSIVDDKLTGYWYDVKDRSQYFGAFQFIMHPSGKQMVGRWVGFSAKGEYVRHGDWNLLLKDPN